MAYTRNDLTIAKYSENASLVLIERTVSLMYVKKLLNVERIVSFDVCQIEV